MVLPVGKRTSLRMWRWTAARMLGKAESRSGIKSGTWIVSHGIGEETGWEGVGQDLWLPLLPRLSRMAFRARESNPSTDLGERPMIWLIASTGMSLRYFNTRTSW